MSEEVEVPCPKNPYGMPCEYLVCYTPECPRGKKHCWRCMAPAPEEDK